MRDLQHINITSSITLLKGMHLKWVVNELRCIAAPMTTFNLVSNDCDSIDMNYYYAATLCMSLCMGTGSIRSVREKMRTLHGAIDEW